MTDIFTEAPKHDHIEKAQSILEQEFEKVIQSRRSVRVFTEESISEEIMEKVFDAALLAPNSSNLQPWQFYWVRSSDLKKKIRYACLDQPAAKTAQELVVCVARMDTWKEHRVQMLKIFKESDQEVPKAAIDYYEKLVPLAYSQGRFGLWGLLKKVILFFRGLSGPTPRGPSSKADMRVWAHKSCALACENMMLAFRAYGFDSCPMEGMDEARIKEYLDLPGGAEVCMVISAGKRADNGVYGPRIRFDREQFIKRV